VIFPLLTWLAWLERLGGLGLILLGLADNSPVPLPGSMDVLTVILSAHQRKWWPYYACMAVIGSLLGAYVSYQIGRKGGKEALEKELPKDKTEKIYRKFKEHGFWTLFLPALLPPPFPYSPFPLAAGTLNYPFRRFLLAVGLARAIRYTGLAFLASIYGKGIVHFFQRYYQPLLWTLVALASAGALAALIWTIKRKREGKPVFPNFKGKQSHAT
jgi:membrane protein DedA with SNARE-associated domain